MFTGKKGPVLLISLLVTILVFIVGMNYGKKVEEADKTIRYVLSLTPSAKPTVINTQISYEEFINELCGFTFLYPNNLTIQKQASTEALLKSDTESIEVSCDKEVKLDTTLASTEALLDNKAGIVLTNKNIQEYRVRDNDNQLIIIKTTKELAPLIEKTFSFKN